jgi:hypothetical protein
MKSFAAVVAFVAGANAYAYGAYNTTSSYEAPTTTEYPVYSSSSAEYPISYITSVQSTYETYCSESTEFTYGTKTYTVSTPGTYTITDQPCTVTAPVYSTPTTICTTSTTPVTYHPSATPVYSTGGYYPTTTPVVAGAGKVAPMGVAAVLALAALL